MSERDRVGAIAAGLAVAFGAVFAVGLWAGSTRDYGKPEGEYYQQAYTSPDPYAPQSKRLAPGPDSYQEICANPKSHDDADLCDQWRAANAARDSALAAWWQIGLGLAGVIGVTATVYYARRAAVHAREAVSEAQRNTLETMRIGETQVRAYVSWDGIRTGVSFSDEEGLVPVAIRFSATMKNTGQSPAFIHILFVDLSIVPVDMRPSIIFDSKVAETYHELGAGGYFSFIDQWIKIEDAAAVRDGRRQCFLVAWCAYRDVFWKQGDPDRIMKVCFKISIESDPSSLTRERVVSEHFNFIGTHAETDYRIEPS